MESTLLLENEEKYIEQPVLVPTKRILIVEDDLTMEPIWSHILERVDHHNLYEWATREDEAERKITESLNRAHPFDLVISDVFLAGPKTGIDLWHRFSSIIPSKMILMSALAKNKFLNFIGQDGPRPVYLQKPLEIVDCIETIYFMLHKPH